LNKPDNLPQSFLLYDATGRRWLSFTKPLQIYQAFQPDEVNKILETVRFRSGKEQLWVAGFLSYEAAPAFDPAFQTRPGGDFPLVWFALFNDAQECSLPGPEKEEAWPELHWQPTVTQNRYRNAFRRIKYYIREGDTYQVNYSFRLRSPFSTEPRTLFQRMIQTQGPGYGAFVETEDWAVCSASPELFFDLENGRLFSKPMKGTAPRGLTLEDDLAQADWLHHSEKNRAENIMIVDMMRNDMNRIALPGTVEVSRFFDTEKYPTLWQMTSTVECRTGVGAVEVLQNLFPAASITGAPKIRTMKIIRELETTPRQIYTGSIGFISPAGKAQFNVAIRTVLIDKRRQTAEYGLGGGIVWDSESADEYQECYTKARVLLEDVPAFDLLETLRWSAVEGFVLLEAHVQRMGRSAQYFSRPFDLQRLVDELKQAANNYWTEPQRVRLLLRPDGSVAIENEPLQELPELFRVALAVAPVDSADRFLYHKTTRRTVYEKARVSRPGHDDVLLWNKDGEITESTIANVICELDGEWLTPPVKCGLLPGIYRAELIKQGKIREAVIRVEDLRRCSRFFLINSVRGLWPVELDFF